MAKKWPESLSETLPKTLPETLNGSKIDSSDEKLMQAYQNGDESAFKLLYARHSSKIYGFLHNRLSNRSLKDDLFQATFLKLHKTRHLYDPKFPFMPWLFTVCKSAMIDGLRQKDRALAQSDDSLLAEIPATEFVPDTDSPHTLPSFTSLPEAQKRALELRYIQEHSFEEIAERLQTSPSNARKLVSRAIKRLKLLIPPSTGRKS